jgi:hypothetical protein
MPEDLMADSRDATKPSFCSVEKPIGRERLMWSGRGAPRSLVKNELTLEASPGGRPSFKFEISLDNDPCSVVAGYPQSSQQRFIRWLTREGFRTYTRCRDG